MWNVRNLRRSAVGVSASRRTDIPALFSAWFAARLAAGVVEYIPAGPPRRVTRSILPEDVTHFNFWSKWPRPFFGVLDRVLTMGYPVLWNVTITGLGGSPVEPRVPDTEKAVAALLELSTLVPPAAIQWRYDPIFVSQTVPCRSPRSHVPSISGAALRTRGPSGGLVREPFRATRHAEPATVRTRHRGRHHRLLEHPTTRPLGPPRRDWS
jgi:hypothetical protein